MSSKSDRDNRANQLNPNNDAYASSRGWGLDNDNDENDRPPHGNALENWLAREAYEHRMREWARPVEDNFFAAFVSLNGPKKLIKFRVASIPFMGNRQPCRMENEDYAEILLGEVGRQLSILWNNSLALQVLYDDNGEDLFWAGFEYPNGSRRTPENEQRWVLHARDAVLEARHLLSHATSTEIPDLEDWGLIEKYRNAKFASMNADFRLYVEKLISQNQINRTET